MRRLAVLGGTPAFSEPLHVGRPNIGDRRLFERLVEDVLDTHFLTNEGPQVAAFEERLAGRLGVGHCITTCNSTTALMIVLRTAGAEGEVVVPSFTFPATAHAIRWLGLDPVFVDIDPGTHTLDPRRVEEAITSRTETIVSVHVCGRACDIEALEHLAARHGLVLLFDAATAFDCTYRGRSIGNFGLAETLSFHATKVLTTFEGGAILTNDNSFAERARRMTRFGRGGGSCPRSRHQRQDDRGFRGDGSRVARARRRVHRGQPNESWAILSGQAETVLQESDAGEALEYQRNGALVLGARLDIGWMLEHRRAFRRQPFSQQMVNGRSCLRLIHANIVAVSVSS
jgi:hypothetical protein